MVTRILTYILALTVVGLGTWLVIFMFRSIASAPPTIQTPVIAGMFTVFVTVGSSIFARKNERSKAIEQTTREERAEVYKRFVEAYFKKPFADASKGDNLSEDSRQAIRDVNIDILLWGSNDFVDSYIHFRRIGQAVEIAKQGDLNHDANRIMALASDKLLEQIRTDLGYKRKRYKDGYLFSGLLSDVSEIDTILAE